VGEHDHAFDPGLDGGVGQKLMGPHRLVLARVRVRSASRPPTISLPPLPLHTRPVHAFVSIAKAPVGPITKWSRLPWPPSLDDTRSHQVQDG
jgi:hypothetical protein